MLIAIAWQYCLLLTKICSVAVMFSDGAIHLTNRLVLWAILRNIVGVPSGLYLFDRFFITSSPVSSEYCEAVTNTFSPRVNRSLPAISKYRCSYMKGSRRRCRGSFQISSWINSWQPRVLCKFSNLFEDEFSSMDRIRTYVWVKDESFGLNSYKY